MSMHPTGSDRVDIATVEDVDRLVRSFYRTVAQDDLLGPVFNEVANVDWSEHLPKLTLFWSRALLGVEGYSGNPFRVHAEVHEKQEFIPEHFHRWLALFHDTVDDGWAGPQAEAAKLLARNVAKVHSAQLLGVAIDVDGSNTP